MKNNYLIKIIYFLIIILCYSCNQNNLFDDYKNNEERIEIAQKYILQLLESESNFYESKSKTESLFPLFPETVSPSKETIRKMEEKNILSLGYKEYIIPEKIILNEYEKKVELNLFKNFLNIYYKEDIPGVYIKDRILTGDEKEKINYLFSLIEMLKGDQIDQVSALIKDILEGDFSDTDIFKSVYYKKDLYYSLDKKDTISINENIDVYRGKFGIGRMLRRTNKNMLVVQIKMSEILYYRIFLEL